MHANFQICSHFHYLSRTSLVVKRSFRVKISKINSRPSDGGHRGQDQHQYKHRGGGGGGGYNRHNNDRYNNRGGDRGGYGGGGGYNKQRDFGPGGYRDR